MDDIKQVEEMLANTSERLQELRTQKFSEDQFGRFLKDSLSGVPDAAEAMTACLTNNWIKVHDAENNVIFDIPPRTYAAPVTPHDDLTVLLHEVKAVEEWQPGVHDTDAAYETAGKMLFTDEAAKQRNHTANTALWNDILSHYNLVEKVDGATSNDAVDDGGMDFEDDFS